MTKVYICGKVTGLPTEVACENFERREMELRKLGFVVVNPMKIVPEGTGWEEAMKICIIHLVECEAISPLPDTWESRGAIIEFNLSRALKYPVIMTQPDPDTDYTIADYKIINDHEKSNSNQ